jgi:ATP/maltotriose-dependent transcriptional regulator MalT
MPTLPQPSLKPRAYLTEPGALAQPASLNAEIAERLVLSRRTVEHHVQDIYLKIGASTRAGAAMFAMQHGLLD